MSLINITHETELERASTAEECVKLQMDVFSGKPGAIPRSMAVVLHRKGCEGLATICPEACGFSDTRSYLTSMGGPVGTEVDNLVSAFCWVAASHAETLGTELLEWSMSSDHLVEVADPLEWGYLRWGLLMFGGPRTYGRDRVGAYILSSGDDTPLPPPSAMAVTLLPEAQTVRISPALAFEPHPGPEFIRTDGGPHACRVWGGVGVPWWIPFWRFMALYAELRCCDRERARMLFEILLSAISEWLKAAGQPRLEQFHSPLALLRFLLAPLYDASAAY